MNLKTETFLVYLSGILFWAAILLGLAVFCGCGPTDDPPAFNGYVKGVLVFVALFAMLFSRTTAAAPYWLAFSYVALRWAFVLAALALAVLLPACGGVLERQFAPEPACYVIDVVDCADGTTNELACVSEELCRYDAAAFMLDYDCNTAGVPERVESCEGLTADHCAHVAEGCW